MERKLVLWKNKHDFVLVIELLELHHTKNPE
jgi:hypothetical protein